MIPVCKSCSIQGRLLPVIIIFTFGGPVHLNAALQETKVPEKRKKEVKRFSSRCRPCYLAQRIAIFLLAGELENLKNKLWFNWIPITKTQTLLMIASNLTNVSTPCPCIGIAHCFDTSNRYLLCFMVNSLINHFYWNLDGIDCLCSMLEP